MALSWRLHIQRLLREQADREVDEAKLLPGGKRMPRATALKLAQKLIQSLGLEYWGPDEVTMDTELMDLGMGVGFPVGSLRQGKGDVGDLDIIVTTPISKATVAATKGVENVSGGAKRIDFVYQPSKRLPPKKVNIFVFNDPKTWGAALLHATGPFVYNVRIRNKAKKVFGWKLSQNGIVDGNNRVLDTPTERDVQQALKVTEREPTER